MKLYIATTIDGFIARENGSLDWLFALPNPGKLDYGYNEFFKGIDRVVMGRSTYEEILGFGVDWPYADCKSFVFTSDKSYEVKTKNTEVLHEINSESIGKIRTGSALGTWVVGGGKLISAFLEMQLIDEMILSVIPVILGKGIRLFPNKPRETRFELKNAEVFQTGVVNLWYLRKG